MKKVLIIFSGEHLAYSPTTLTLYDLLSNEFEVTILAEKPITSNVPLINNRKIIYRKKLHSRVSYKINRLLYSVYSIFDKDIKLIKKKSFNVDSFYNFKSLRKHLLKNSYDYVIAIDFDNLFYTQILDKKVEFLSLEIKEEDKFYKNCHFRNINSVIIQTKERYNYLFHNKEFKTFLIQNAPIYQPIEFISNRKDLVFCGAAINEFGFYHCLEFLKKFPNRILHIKGFISPDSQAKIEKDFQSFPAKEQVIIDTKYLDDNQIINYLSQFKVGFCLYNFEIKSINCFNYNYVPSGKMFKYLAAGVPVIAQSIPGMSAIKEFDCGVLIEDLKPETINQAVEKIESNFEYYSKNCLKAAKHYSFDKATKPFIEYLLES